MTRRQFLRQALAASALCGPFAALVLPGAALAQNYPNRPVTLVVPFAPGGGTDSIAREMAVGLSQRLGKPVVVDNRGGAGGAIAAKQVASSPADGHTLLFVTSTFVTHVAAEPKPSYDAVKDFAPVAMIGRGPLMVVTRKGLGTATLEQIVAASKARPEGLSYCSSGVGGINHMAGELFAQKTGAVLSHVPYKGSGPATLDLLAGRIDVFFSTVPTIQQYVKSGQVDLVAVTDTKRMAGYPNTPTAAEAGLKDFNISTWWGIVAPAGTPEPIVARLNGYINEISASEAIKKRLTNEGAETYSMTSAQFKAALGQETALWRGVAKAANIKTN
ncbi:Tripartite-type tricarboxylate transporter, receptor component TctC [Noviherbaspirillum humi]|uniref:Tripartite-type tricarboxylate transporter, receptor component TctC n=1 Tax=Noviherbaspirillum humi TaxID=1688639 RepID=A0A239JRG2_9BURK|nr:tripartite tricarboxylate transporter substrate binding protein [Noviherbaspirillum humi]SNT08616.1 Tripartite-type tricarboxylate transporter, receptor component TctC [Noviherbaspirillum humi]